MPTNPFPGLPRKAVPPPKRTRKVRLGLDTFVYNCYQCGKEHSHSTGYMFITRYQYKELYFCNIDCCDDWEKANPELKSQSAEPVPDRRGAILATREKNEEADSRT